MSEAGPPLVDTQIIPVMARTDSRFTRDGRWNDDRTGGFVMVGLAMALAFLLVAAAIWWAGGRGRTSDALATEASTIAPATEPALAGVAAPVAASTLPLSSYPLPVQGLAGTEMPQGPPPAPAEQAPSATQLITPPPSIPDTAALAAPTTTVAPTTTLATSTTIAAVTTTVAPTTVASTVAPTSAPTSAPTTAVPVTTTPPTTTPSTSSTAPPAATLPPPVVTSPATADATLLDVVVDSPDLSRARELVDMSGFAPELEAERALTFLAPSNAAIDAWAATPDGHSVLADPDAVYDLLLRHLVPEALDETAIFTRTSLTTMSGDRLVVRQQSHTIDGADLLVVDVTAANGNLHVVSDVLTGLA